MSAYEDLNPLEQRALRRAAFQLQHDLVKNGLETPPELLFSPEVIHDVSCWIARTANVPEIVRAYQADLIRTAASRVNVPHQGAWPGLRF